MEKLVEQYPGNELFRQMLDDINNIKSIMINQ